MNGQVIKSIGQGVLHIPDGIHVDEASNIVYVADWKRGVFLFDIVSGQMIRKIEAKDRQGQNSKVKDVTFTNQGHLLVAEHTERIQLFNNEGRFMKVFVKAGDENGKVMYPHGVVVDEDDNIIISSYHKLQLFSSDGNFIKRIDKEEDGINKPWGLSIISYHPRRVVVTNGGDKTIKIFNY